MACEGCNCGAAATEKESTTSSPQSVEDYKRELEDARSRAEKAEKLLKQLQQEQDFTSSSSTASSLRSQKWWFNNSHNPGMTALYLERYLNFGLTAEELQSGKPIIGIAQTGSDLSPCNRHHMELAKRVREGIRMQGAIAMEFPVHPIQETGKRPTACLDRNLAYMGLVELLFGYPIDGVVLLTGCDKTTPACLMAAATVNIPAIVMNVGPMLNGYFNGEYTGSGTIVWKCRELLATGEIDLNQFYAIVSSSAPSPGHCNTMGTASTMNALAEALGMALPGSASIPAVYRERSQCAYETGKRIVDLVKTDVKPSDILTRQAFENAIAINSAIGGSTNAPIHLNAVAKHIGVPLDNNDWQKFGHEIPLLVNVQPAGEYLCEEYHRAGNLPAVTAELISKGKIHESVLTANGKTMGDNCKGKFTNDRRLIKPYDEPLVHNAGFLNLTGTLFDSAIMKTSVISEDFSKRYLRTPGDENAFEGKVAVFDGPEDYHDRIETMSDVIDAHTILIMRGAGPVGYPGAAEVVNMQPPAELLKSGVSSLPCIGDGRQSGTSGSPSILNASPEAAIESSGLAIIQTGDRIRIDLNKCTADILLSESELEERRQKYKYYSYPESQTPWQEIFRKEVSQLDQGMVLKGAVKYQDIAHKSVPRDNH